MKKVFESPFGSAVVMVIFMIATIFAIIMFPGFYWKGRCPTLAQQQMEHNTQNLYPGFYVTDEERIECSLVGINL